MDCVQCGKPIPEGRRACSTRCWCDFMNGKPRPVPDFDPSMKVDRCSCCGIQDDLENGLCYRCSKIVRNEIPLPIPIPRDPFPTDPEDEDETETDSVTESKNPEEIYV